MFFGSTKKFCQYVAQFSSCVCWIFMKSSNSFWVEIIKTVVWSTACPISDSFGKGKVIYTWF